MLHPPTTFAWNQPTSSTSLSGAVGAQYNTVYSHGSHRGCLASWLQGIRCSQPERRSRRRGHSSSLPIGKGPAEEPVNRGI